jgi:cysteine-rich repeat protein
VEVMRGHRGTWIGVLWALAFGCNGLAGIEEGAPRSADYCVTDADCEALVEEPECRKRPRCEKNHCDFDGLPDGTPLDLGRQTPGDCRVVVCGGGGLARVDQDLGDPADDGNPCTLDECKGFSTEHTARSFAPCYPGPAGTLNVGRCAAGIQQCEDGSPHGACSAAVLPAPERCDGTSNDEDCDGEVNEGGEGCVCAPGATTPCYTGPAMTEDVGPCHAGVSECNAFGTAFGACVGEQTPVQEICEPPGMDEDCNGLLDDAPICHCGDGILDPGEACDDGNVVASDTCTADCRFATCGDGIVALTESCDDGNVEDGDTCPASCQLPVSRISVGGHSCAVLPGIGVKCWGANTGGQLGLGDMKDRGDEPGEMGNALPPVDLGSGKVALDVVASGIHTCALLEDGSVKCWGFNVSGELGLGDELDRGYQPGQMGDVLAAVDLGAGKKAVAIAAGGRHTCVILQEGSVKCWGHNQRGELGAGDVAHRGDNPGEMGDALPAIDLGTGVKAAALTAGAHHVCVLLRHGRVKCWGDNTQGELGLGDKNVRGDDPGEMGDALPAVDLGTGKRVVAIDAGADFTCALLDEGSVKCWGQNNAAQLGLGALGSLGDGVGEMGDALPAVDLGAGNQVTGISVGSFACAQMANGSVKCWGYNVAGQLGLGDTNDRGDGFGEMGEMLPAVDLGAGAQAISSHAGGSACVRLLGGLVKCWGRNIQGQCGLGDVAPRGDQSGEMGGNLPLVSLF